jgi:hypothetical protein
MRFTAILTTLVTALVATAAFADFSDYRDRDSARFVVPKPRAYKADKDVAVIIMREGIPRGGGYTYQYPRENPEPFMTDQYAKQGDLSMEIALISDDYSGVAIAIAGTADLTPYLEEGALEFWIKGEVGGEIAQYVLIDDGVKSNGESLQLKVNSKTEGPITNEWKRISIPLKTFGGPDVKGLYWDVKNQRDVYMPFAWDRLKGFRLEVRKGDNPQKLTRVWIDDIVIKKFGKPYEGPAGYPFRNVL